MRSADTSHRFYEIDLLRFLAALSVVFFHYGFRGYAADNMTTMPYLWAAPFTKYGYLGVHLFFIISGFVILMTASSESARAFMVSRIVRLYPAFWVCCTITFLAILFLGGTRYSASWRQYTINMTMLNNMFGVESIDGVYWSLFVEIKFYCLVLLALLMGQISNVKELLGIWLAAALIMTKWYILEFPGFRRHLTSLK
jgi:peptidoglycan/LPS O-acetylase OafA/YrhL